MPGPENPWSKIPNNPRDGATIFQEAVFDVRRTIDQAKAPKDLKEIALDALIAVENRLPIPAITPANMHEMGDPSSIIFLGVITLAAQKTGDVDVVKKLYDAFGEHFPMEEGVLDAARQFALRRASSAKE